MNYSEAIISGLLLGLFIAISVGPTLFAVIRYSMHHSYKAGLAFVLGVSVSDILYVTLANFASSWLNFLEEHQKVVAYAGSALFIGIGLFALLKKYKPKRPKRSADIQISTKTYFKIWGSGFLMNALNPAAIILWIGAAIKVADYTIWQRVVFFGICLGVVLSGDISKVLLADRIRNWLTLRKIMYLNRVSAVCILAFGLILLAKTYFGLKFS
ncbi:MAG TPA: LysE family transporter [Edaphocola sp.]|nr:LysE family transporter [Edaphocola sp.]